MVAATVSSTGTTAAIKQAADIARINRQEAQQLAMFEVKQVIQLLEQLDGDDWAQPTDCTEWNVRDMVAHLAGAMTGSTSLREFVRQNVTHPYVKAVANSVDGTNRMQIDERASQTTA